MVVTGADAGSSPLARGLHPQGRRGAPVPRIIPARAGFTLPPTTCQPTCRDHPRSRGVYGGVAVDTGETTGSSPLARGLPGAGRQGHRHRRIIPARAGFTTDKRVGPSTTPDHPRSRGVYQRGYDGDVLLTGSSPLARGLRLAHPLFHGGPGIIPARAGFTPAGGPRRSPRPDHPRSRGVYRSRM